MFKGYLLKRRFYSIFNTQFLNAFNDNVLKNSLILLIAYQNYTLFNFDPKQMISIASFLFTLPFFLFSPHAGYLSDKHSKSRVVQTIKAVEILIMFCALVAFYFENMLALIVVLFFMGAQSAFFGPAKLSILPELLEPEELLGANSMFTTGTYLAILMGTAVGGVAVSKFGETPYKIGIVVLTLAILGFLSSLQIPKLDRVKNNNTAPRKNIIAAIKSNMAIAFAHQHLRYPIALTGWLWFFGSYYLIVIPNLAKDYMGAGEGVATMLMACISVGIAFGSSLCTLLHRLIRNYHIIVLIGIWGMFITNTINFLIYWNKGIHTEELMSIAAFFSNTNSYFIFFNFFIMAAAGGLFIVPIQTYIQHAAPDEIRSQVISSGNILQSALILLASLILFVFFKFGVTIPQTLLVLAVFNVFLLVIYLRNKLTI
ncbi:MAG: MFS transporter [Halobacteriovoraceae bacterium]|nr:MFS transporter [Halobacteriovoraceae bacterium]MCB9095806.1 MFS transporter [Halobacteriovoraceae bacterium]